MIAVIPNQVVCKNCMTILKYENSDVIKTTTKYPNMEFEAYDNRDILRGGCWEVNGYKEVSQEYIECPICKTKIVINKNNYEDINFKME